MKNLALVIITVFLAFTVNGKEDKGKTTNDSESEATTVLTGTVADSGSGELLAGVEIQLEGTDMKTYTDFDGNFSFKVKPGEYKVVANYISYKKCSETLNAGKDEKEVKIKLQTSN